MPISSWPNSLTEPLSAVRSPVIRLNSVVLPAPFGPMISRRSPGMTVSETFLVAGRPPKRLLRPVDFERGRGHAAGSGRGDLRSADAACAEFCSDAPPQLPAARHQAVGHEHDDDHEDRAEQRVPALDVGRDHVLDQRDDGRADDRAGERAGAAEDRHQQDFGGLLQRDRVRAEEQVVVDEQDAGDRAPEAGHDEGQPAGSARRCGRACACGAAGRACPSGSRRTASARTAR